MRIGFVVIVSVLAVLFWKFSSTELHSAAKEVELRKILPMDISYESMEARNQLNAIREAMGLNRLEHNDALTLAAQAHADYLVANQEDSHYEVEGHKKFTGVRPVDRALHANYASSSVSENLSTKNHSAQESIDGLFSAIYHRFGFLSVNIDEVGVGLSQNKENSDQSAFVYLMGNSILTSLCHGKSFSGHGKYYYKMCKDEKHRISEKAYVKAQGSVQQFNPNIVLFPYDGQKEVSPVFYSESPDPLPDYEVSGFPVSISFNDYFFDKVSVHTFKLFNAQNVEVENVRFMDKSSDPHARFTDKEFALFPLERLDYATKYRAEVAYSHKGKEAQISWTFTTKVPTEKFYVIESNEESISLQANGTYVIYFKPKHASDILKNVQFPANIDLVFLDNNTIKITINDESGSFDIQFKSKVLHVTVD